MTKKDTEIRKIENFVRSVLDKNFNQKVAPDTLRAVAKKIQAVTRASANIRRNPRITRASSPAQKSCQPDRHC
jgi:hypothetical protein